MSNEQKTAIVMAEEDWIKLCAKQCVAPSVRLYRAIIELRDHVATSEGIECWDRVNTAAIQLAALAHPPQGGERDGRINRLHSVTIADAIIAEHIAPLRTENETLRAERDAAIARVEALAKVSLIQARELKRLDPHGNTPPDLDAAMADLRAALTTPEQARRSPPRPREGRRAHPGRD